LEKRRRKMTSEMDFEIDNFVQKLQEEISEEEKETFSEVVIDRFINPRNLGSFEEPDGYARITGICGDTMEIYLRIKDEKIVKCSFFTDGCGPSIACGSIVAELATGKSIIEAKGISQETVLKACGGLPESHTHCALLASYTLNEAIKEYETLKRQPWKKAYRKLYKK
jgi:nitrogen fixation NifU-like protein